MDNIRYLINRLNELTKAYDEGHPEVSDEMWDDMYFELETLEKNTGLIYPDSPTQKIDYQVVNGLTKVEHDHPMLSLPKTKFVSDIEDFVAGRACVSMGKLDGLTCSLTYENGQLIRAETRGNGIIGEDVTHNAKAVNSIPQYIDYKDRLVVDGEIICTYNDFKEFESDYKNPRNFASGSIRLLDAKECAKRKLTFVAWDMIEGYPDIDYLHKRLQQLSNLGFTVVHFRSIFDIDDDINYIKKCCQVSGWPIDGVVFKLESKKLRDSLPQTSHHLGGAIAFKFYDEEYETYLQNIEWTMGRTGVLTPVAVFDPVDDGESTITRASLHNVSIMKQTLFAPYKRQKIWVCKQNQIIPQISKASKDVAPGVIEFFVPTICPVCGGRTEIRKDNDSEVLICTNPECDGRLINQLDHFAGKKGLDIKGLSKVTLEKLIDLGWLVNVEGIFSLKNYRNEWIKLSGFGVKSVDNILDAIEQSKNCEMANFITALGIPLIGSTYAKDICKHEETWTDFKRDIEDGFDFSEWDGFGYEMNKAIHDYDYFEADHIGFDILNLKNSLFNNKKENTALDGIKVCITGSLNKYKNRDEFTKDIEAYGGKVVSSVSKNTNILVNNDIESSSSKNQNAKKFGIPILTEQAFIDKYLT